MRSEGIVIAFDGGGHRRPYVEFLANLLSFKPVIGRPNFLRLIELLGRQRVLFATIDDGLAVFALVGIARMLIGRETVGFLIRSQSTLKPLTVLQHAKRVVLRILLVLPRVTVLSILPFSVEPRLREIVGGAIHDPQFWDQMHGTAVPPPTDSELAQEILSIAGDRPVLTLPGGIALVKGFQFLADTLAANPSLAGAICAVAVGAVADECKEAAALFTDSGGVLIDRYISDFELESLYLVSDAIWSCYRPDYDQASGVFGRAIQFGVPALVRSGSIIERIAAEATAAAVPVAYGDTSAAAEAMNQIMTLVASPEAETQRDSSIRRWREESVLTLHQALNPLATQPARLQPERPQ